jgi:hypothetical protein
MKKQQTVKTSMGDLTFTSLNLGELRQLDALFKETPPDENMGVGAILKYLPIVLCSVRKVHQDMTSEQLENGIDSEDFTACFGAIIEISGIKKATPGEAPAATA